MPNLNGLDACRQLKAASETQAIPVILVTAKGAQMTANQIQEIGAMACVPKPYEPADLLARIREAIG